MRILCCGDRNWTSISKIRTRLEEYRNTDTTIIHGNARGADRLSAQVAMELGLKVLSFPAQWERYGKAAGPIRNQQMLDEGSPELVIAFHNDIENSKGTKDMLNRAKVSGRFTELVTE